jgi:hypothetical protein
MEASHGPADGDVAVEETTTRPSMAMKEVEEAMAGFVKVMQGVECSLGILDINWPVAGLPEVIAEVEEVTIVVAEEGRGTREACYIKGQDGSCCGGRGGNSSRVARRVIQPYL